MVNQKDPSPVGWVSKILVVRFTVVLLVLAAFFVFRVYSPASTGSGTDQANTADVEQSLTSDGAQSADASTAPGDPASVAQAQDASSAPAPTPAPVEPRATAWPARLLIPALAVDAPIEDTGYDDTETMEIVASPHIISWLREGPIPGNEGNAILGGHNRWSGVDGDLLYLDEMAIGDEMEILYADGSRMTFLLESVFVYPLAFADADRIMDLEGEPRVTVITCKDPYNPAIGTSDNRIIAIFKEESDFVFPDPPIEPFPLIDPEDLETEV